MKTTPAFPEPNHTQTPNNFFAMIPDMSDSELRVTLVMIRQTFGFHRDGFKMGVTKLAAEAGLSRQGALDGAEAARKRGTFRRSNPGIQGEAEWELIVSLNPVEALNTVEGTVNPVEGKPLRSRGQVGIKESTKENIKEIVDSANKTVDAIIVAGLKKTYANRDKIPEVYLEYCDVYVQLTGQEPRKPVLQNWLMEFSEWQSAGVNVKNIRDAFDKSKEGHWMVTSPSSLTKTALALKGAERVSNVDPLAPFRYTYDKNGKVKVASPSDLPPDLLARIT